MAWSRKHHLSAYYIQVCWTQIGGPFPVPCTWGCLQALFCVEWCYSCFLQFPKHDALESSLIDSRSSWPFPPWNGQKNEAAAAAAGGSSSNSRDGGSSKDMIMSGDNSMLNMIHIHQIVCNREWCEEREESSSFWTHLRIPGYLYLVGMGQVTIVHSENIPHCHFRGSHLFYHQHFPAPFNTSYQQLLWSLVARTSDLPSDLLKLQSIGKPHLAHGFVYFDKVVNKVHPGFPDLLESSRMGRWWVRREWRQHWRDVSRRTHSKYEITLFAVDSFHFDETSSLSTVLGCVCVWVCLCMCVCVYVSNQI